MPILPSKLLQWDMHPHTFHNLCTHPHLPQQYHHRSLKWLLQGIHPHMFRILYIHQHLFLLPYDFSPFIPGKYIPVRNNQLKR